MHEPAGPRFVAPARPDPIEIRVPAEAVGTGLGGWCSGGAGVRGAGVQGERAMPGARTPTCGPRSDR
ncbi:protein of unknown function (plasmid) [Streptantibioticus cattleyicolor NRRL 8057 = DSM 46488]|nr:protein of unknown function [Streptantibioticus cattleyicolor NRRL 8057 = DSM 46488]